MGTSHRHTPSVAGKPNWSNASAAMTRIASAEERLDQLNKELKEIEESEDLGKQEDKEQKKPATASAPDQIFKRQRKLDSQIQRNYHKAVSYLVKAAGGKNKVVSGASRAIGRAGVSIAGGFISAISDIVKNGLTDWLGRRGVTSLEGRSCQDVLDLIRDYIEEDVAGLDNTAANEALEYVLDELGQRAGDDLNSFEELMNSLLASGEIKNIIDKFFGMYIYSHLSQDFKEKLEYEKGTKVANETMNEIKELILDDIKRSLGGRNASSIDWNTSEGEAFRQAEFDRILYIMTGDED